MEILVAKSAGFCFGVEKAIESVYKEIETGKKPIYTFGPIIHNEQVVEDLEKKGVSVIDTVEELENLQSGSVVIRSHGVPKKIYDAIEKQNLEIVDATCPFVKKIHNIVKKESEEDKRIVIIGNDNHPEVEGIKGWVVGEAIVIKDEEDIEKIDSFRNESICIVSQTTFNYNKFKYLVEIITKKGYDINVVNTICNATHLRQVEAKEIASKILVLPAPVSPVIKNIPFSPNFVKSITTLSLYGPKALIVKLIGFMFHLRNYIINNFCFICI